MKTIYRILLPVLMVLSAFAAGCTEKFDDPAPRPATTDADIAADGYTIVSIKTIKKLFAAYYPDYATSSASFRQGVTIHADSLPKIGMDSNTLIAIKGRVISTDYNGNVYRSIYLLDASELPANEQPEAIEIKVGLTGLFVDYRFGDIVYVKCQGLIIGNYRYNLSLGAKDATGNYGNGHIDRKAEIRSRFLVGKKNSELPPIDIPVFNSTNSDIFSYDLDPSRHTGDGGIDLQKVDQISALVGRLVRFEPMTCVNGTTDGSMPGFSGTDVYPSFLQQKGTSFTNYNFINVIREWKNYDAAVAENPSNPPAPPKSPRPGKMFPTWAFNNGRDSYYGSALFKVGEPDTSDMPYFVIRSSGYSNFALEALPFEYETKRMPDGKLDVEVKGDKTVKSVTGILTRYASSNGGFRKYQILLNSSRDVAYDRDSNVK